MTACRSWHSQLMVGFGGMWNALTADSGGGCRQQDSTRNISGGGLDRGMHVAVVKMMNAHEERQWLT